MVFVYGEIVFLEGKKKLSPKALKIKDNST